MSLTIINNDNYLQAIDLLNRLADPESGISHWEKTLNNLMVYANKKETAPGYLLEIKGKFVSILLTIECSRTYDGKQYNFVNISSLYIEVEFRHLAGVVLNEIIRIYDGYIITETTANDDALKVLKKLGFVQKSKGSMLKFPNRISINTRLINRIDDKRNEDYPEYITDHINMGCLVYEIMDEKKGNCLIVLKKVRPVKSINFRFAGFLIHCSNHDIFRENISKIMTKLMFNGIFIVSLPNRDEYNNIGYVYKRETKQRISALGNIQSEHVDWAYTELAIYHY
jgi:hypothetical protein